MAPNMNRRTEAKSLAKEIGDKLELIAVNGGRQLDLDSFEFKRLLLDCDRISRDQNIEERAVLSSTLKASLYALAGDRDNAVYWAKNADQNRGGYAPVSEYSVLTLLGYPKDALPLFDAAFARREGDVDHYLKYAVSYGWFARAATVIEQCRKDNLVHKPLKCLGMIPRAAKIFSEHGIGEDLVSDVTTVMHDILRENRMVWLGFTPAITLHNEGTPDAYVLMRFAIDARPDRAAELSWELTERVVANNYDIPGLVVSFAPGIAAIAPEEAQPAFA
jgi:hypothetical protein